MSLHRDKEDDFSSLPIIVVVAFFYAVTGYAGLFLAAPPGYATAIWIPSGIALGATLIWGLRVLPGVFLGSLITNFFVSSRYVSEPTFLIPLLIGIIIAFGAALQAYVGYYLIKRLVGLHNLLYEPNDIMLFAFLSGPVSCLINTTWSNTALTLLGMMPANLNTYAFNWATWWIGDSMGVLIFTPLFLILFAQPRMIWQQRIVPVLLPLVISFLVIVVTSLGIYHADLKRLHTNFELVLSNSLLSLEHEIANERMTPTNTSDVTIIHRAFKNTNDFKNLNIYDASQPENIRHLYSLYNKESKAVERYPLQVEKKVKVDGRNWTIIASPSSAFITRSFSWQSWFFLLSGLLFCALMNIILFILNGQKSLALVGMHEKAFALKKAESENLMILRAAGEGIYGLDEAGSIRFINPAAAKMLGYAENEVVGKKIHELIHHSYPDGSPYPWQACPMRDSFLYNREYHVRDEVFWRKDGSPFWVEYTVTPLLEDNHTTGVVVVFEDVSSRREIELQLERLAHYDQLTGLPNRITFIKKLQKATNQAKADRRHFAICIIDMDNFKQINDSLGHRVGDETLKLVANLIKSQLRNGDYLAHIGGDEFGVILNDLRTEDDIAIILEHIIATLKRPLKINKLEISISVSIGVAIYGIAGYEAEELIKNTDIAMDYAKELGRGTYAFYDENIHRKIKRQNQVDLHLRNSLIHNEFSLEYQLQVNNEGQPVGIETLLRWHNSELGDVTPSEFITIAEKNGMIYSIGEWVLQQACEDYKLLQQTVKDKTLILSINVSVMQLENTHFRKSLERILAETKVLGEYIMLEITETALMRNPEYILRVMTQIKKLGVRFALDDFGMSYSSLQYLKKLPVSYIKIDKGFVEDMTTNSSDEKIVNASIQLSRVMGIHSIAEGVETEEQIQLLKKMGCEYMQGFYFAKPMGIEALLKSEIFRRWVT